MNTIRVEANKLLGKDISILNLDKDSAVLKRVRKGYSENDELLEYTINYYDAKLYRYSVEVASIEKVKR